jgi:hypothetical protein
VAPRLLPSRLKKPFTEEQKREGGEMAVSIEKIIATVLDEAHKQQVEESMDTLKEGSEGLSKRKPY